MNIVSLMSYNTGDLITAHGGFPFTEGPASSLQVSTSRRLLTVLLYALMRYTIS